MRTESRCRRRRREAWLAEAKQREDPQTGLPDVGSAAKNGGPKPLCGKAREKAFVVIYSLFGDTVESPESRKVYFDNKLLNEIAWAWSDTAQADHQIVALWFEADSPKDLLSPKKYYAFHLAIRDDAFDAFLPYLTVFAAKAGTIEKEMIEEFVWPYPPTFPGESMVPDDQRRCLACWLTFSDGTKIDLILEREGFLGNIPRACFRPILKKDLDLNSFLRARAGRGHRVIKHRPVRQKGA
jgi:hypothetical protein